MYRRRRQAPDNRPVIPKPYTEQPQPMVAIVSPVYDEIKDVDKVNDTYQHPNFRPAAFNAYDRLDVAAMKPIDNSDP